MIQRLPFSPALAFSLLASCGVPTATNHSFQDIARITGDLPRDRATIFVHIPASMPPVKATVLVDGREIAQLPAGAFTKVSLSPGVHRIGVKYPPLLGRKVVDYSLAGEAGTVYHLRLVDGPGSRTFGAALSNEFLQATAHFVPVGAGDGIELSRHESYSAAR
jgi:hypothetical protein